MLKLENVSVPMRGFNDFNINMTETLDVFGKFPSPCGVLMILIVKGHPNEKSIKKKFPSPCGVLMILIASKI